MRPVTATLATRDRRSSPRAARVAVAVTFVALGVGGGSWATRIPAVQHRIGLSAAELGVALFGLGFGSLISMPGTGLLIARHGSRPVLRATALLFAISVALPALAWNLPSLWLALTLFGAAQGALDVAMNSHGVAVEHAYGRPILSSFHAAFSAGALLGAALGALAAGIGIDARVHLAAVAAIVLVSAVASARFLLPAAADRGASGQRLTLRVPRQLVAVGIVAFLCLLAEGAASDWSAVYLAGPLHASPDVAAAGFAGFAGAMMLGRLAGDRLVTALGEVMLVRGGALLAAVGMALGLIAGSTPLAIVAFACLGAGLAGVVPVVFRAAATHPDVPSGIGLAAISTAGYTGFLLGPPVIGTLASVTTLPRALAAIVLATVAIAALAGRVPVRRRSRMPTG
jgi:predicted MFS family arabinose efflux permease